MPTQPQARPALQPSKNGGSVSGYHELMTSLTAQWSRLLSGGQAAELYFHTSPTASRTHYSAAGCAVLSVRPSYAGQCAAIWRAVSAGVRDPVFTTRSAARIIHEREAL